MNNNENEEVLVWSWDLVRFLNESELKKEDGTFKKLSVATGITPKEVYIYMEKDTCSSGFKVTVYKAKPENTYVSYRCDKVKAVEETDKCTVFSFENFESARNFVDMLAYKHPEYQERPVSITE